jgi:hypothetical protein
LADRWNLTGVHLEFCTCDPGCGCNFRGRPNSVEGNCQAFVCEVIESGRFEDVDLAGTRIAWALWWPGAIHEKGGRGRAYVDCTSDEQFSALSAIVRAEAGHPYFEIFNSTFVEPSAVERARVQVTLDGRNSSFTVEGVGVAAMTPLLNPVSSEPNDVRIVKPGGFIWKDGEIAQSQRLVVDLPDTPLDVSGRHAVFAPFEWAA